ncbi:MAG: hypothetical protein RBJ76_14670 [Stenomitos frigidus ULC029]
MDVQRTREFVESHPRIKEPKRQLIFPALDAYESLRNASSISEAELQPIIEAACCRWVSVWDTGGRALAEFACNHPAAQNAFRKMMASRKNNERYQAIASLSPGMPKPLLQELLTLGLSDRSKSVRAKTADRCDVLRFQEMLPKLLQRIEVEFDAQVKERLEFHTAMLQEGYLIRPEEDGSLLLSIRTKSGWSFRTVTQDDVDSDRVPAIVAEAQARP